jgi:hypothetical protein
MSRAETPPRVAAAEPNHEREDDDMVSADVEEVEVVEGIVGEDDHSDHNSDHDDHQSEHSDHEQHPNDQEDGKFVNPFKNFQLPFIFVTTCRLNSKLCFVEDTSFISTVLYMRAMKFQRQHVFNTMFPAQLTSHTSHYFAKIHH